MNDKPTLTAQDSSPESREVGINPNFWYPVGWSETFRPSSVVPITIWERDIAVYRTESGTLRALEDACLHKGVALSLGTVENERIVCAYHGWEFDGEGRCVRIPYLPPERKCPKARIRAFPVRERYGIVWVFPGEPDLAADSALPEVPEYDDPDWLVVQIPAHFLAHFAICNENTMDVFHGHLHKGLQGWFDPVLTKLERDSGRALAEYEVKYKGRLAKLLGIAKSGNEVNRRTVSIEYAYPHYRNSMEGTSSLYLMRLPVSSRETRSYSLMFLKPSLPSWLWRPFRKTVARVLWRVLLKRFLDQDKEMIESEQETYCADPEAKRIEINPAIIALRRVIVEQHVLYVANDQASEQALVS